MQQHVDRLGPDAVGSRVVVRVLVAGGPTMRDVLGELVALGPLLVRRDDNELVQIDPADVVAAKPVPPRPRRQHPGAAMIELERTAAKSWLGPDHEWLGDWLLRAADGFTGRANSVLALGDPGVGEAEAMRRVHDFYARRDLPAQFAVPLPVRADLDDRLTELGWGQAHGAIVLTAALAPIPVRTDLPPVTLAGELDDAWLATYHYRGGGGVPPAALPLFASGAARAFASVREDGEVIAIGRAAADDGWAGVTAVEVAAAHRRRGLAGQVMRAFAAWALELGIDRMWLQVDPRNDAARALYAGLGWREHHRYHYRVAPGRML